jgi:hypothetical protein
MDERVTALSDTLRNSAEKIMNKAEVKEYLGSNKIILIADVSCVKSKVVEPVTRTKKPTQMTKEETQSVKDVKKQLKGNLDVMNLVTLIVRVREELRRIKVKDLDPEKLAALKSVVREVDLEIREKLLGVIR